ncbi:hypothetical protein HanRHA438_Chr06g0279591 [Helianthus annuus]|nr:hypothetical protein HanIR_Chr06g0290611 [Helianthus annuus]KAJ0912907.1 hypothetical protein HanRHA438_Chr06g0279591 [Helianthus annuus]
MTLVRQLKFLFRINSEKPTQTDVLKNYECRIRYFTNVLNSEVKRSYRGSDVTY